MSNNKENIFNISYSKYRTFESCPIKYTFEYILNQRKTTMSFAIASGYLTHLFIEKYINNEISSHLDIINNYYDNTKKAIKENDLVDLISEKHNFPNKDEFIDLMIKEIKKHDSLFFTIVKNVKNTIPFVDKVYNKIAKNKNIYSEQEYHLPVIVNNQNINLHAIIDLFFIDKKNNLYIVDFKTTNKEKYDYKQNLLYAYVLLHLNENNIFKKDEISKVILGFYNPKYYKENDTKYKNFKKIELDKYNINYFFENVFYIGIKEMVKYTNEFKKQFNDLIKKIEENSNYKISKNEYKKIFEFIQNYFDNNELKERKEALTIYNINRNEFKPYIDNELNLCYYCDYKNICNEYLIK